MDPTQSTQPNRSTQPLPPASIGAFDTRDSDLEFTRGPLAAHDAPTEGPAPAFAPPATPARRSFPQVLRTVAAALAAALVVVGMAGAVATFAHPGLAATPTPDTHTGVSSLVAALPTDTPTSAPTATVTSAATSTPQPTPTPTSTPVPHLTLAYTCLSGQYAPGGTGQPDSSYLLYLCMDGGAALAGDYVQIDTRFCGQPAPVGTTTHITVVLDATGKRSITDPFSAPDCANPLPVAGIVTITTPSATLLGTADGFSLTIAH